jgi:CubicO group peptidase (beta-lactamase class C family)
LVLIADKWISLPPMFRIVYFFCLVLCLFSCTDSAQSIREDIVEDADSLSYFPEFNPLTKKYLRTKKKQVSRFYKEHVDQDNFSGMFLVAKNGKIIFERTAGYADFQQKRRLTAETSIHVASISKVATSYLILKLCEEGLIDLDSDVRQYLPELPYEGITVRMLLNHRSGIQYYAYFTHGKWDWRDKLTNQDILKMLVKHKFRLNFPPGRKFSYCNTNFALLALIAERVTDTRFPELMKDRIFDPLGMNNSFIADENSNWDELNPSYEGRWKLQPFNYLDAVYGDKNLYTTARDLLKLDMASYSQLFLSDSLKNQIFKGYSREKRGHANYGLGMRMSEYKGYSTNFFHTGWWHGNTGCYTTLRDDTTCIISISNKFTKVVYLNGGLAPHFGNYYPTFSFE